jgi:hypothetical protein
VGAAAHLEHPGVVPCRRDAAETALQPPPPLGRYGGHVALAAPQSGRLLLLVVELADERPPCPVALHPAPRAAVVGAGAVVAGHPKRPDDDVEERQPPWQSEERTVPLGRVTEEADVADAFLRAGGAEPQPVPGERRAGAREVPEEHPLHAPGKGL